jgi:myo-inositol-1(or 4)-monophosphatase
MSRPEEAVALEAARAAAVLQAQRPTRVQHKGAVDLVTEIDLASERAIRDVLARHTPDIPVLGEEGGGAEGLTTRWVVDPLDGTTNFVHGLPHFGPSVALEVDGEVVAGVIIDVSRREVFRASRGHGAFLGDVPMQVSDVDDLRQALVATGFGYDRGERPGFYLERVERVFRACQGLRRAGAAALDLAWVAAGRLDAYWEFDLGAWDVAAGRLLVEEAGGVYRSVPGHERSARPCPMASNAVVAEAFADLMS